MVPRLRIGLCEIGLAARSMRRFQKSGFSQKRRTVAAEFLYQLAGFSLRNSRFLFQQSDQLFVVGLALGTIFDMFTHVTILLKAKLGKPPECFKKKSGSEHKIARRGTLPVPTLRLTAGCGYEERMTSGTIFRVCAFWVHDSLTTDRIAPAFRR
ncbi:hypothetical protein MPLB_210043 [Mesorhizobium sp. ORS 3324]|nr:hypothetical protein MPLB_210043 [Mesorhizobium sp. ORS 3324]